MHSPRPLPAMGSNERCAWASPDAETGASTATASGQSLSYDSSTNTLVSTVNGGLMSQLISSASGAVMIASDLSGAGTVFSPASGATLDTVNSTGGINSIGLSASGTVFGGANGDAGTLVQGAGGGTILDDTLNYGESVQISPDGSLIAEGTGSFAVAANLITYFYQNGTLTGTPVSWVLPIAWLDNNNLLVNTYTDANIVTVSGTDVVFNGVAIYNASGTLVSAIGLDPPVGPSPLALGNIRCRPPPKYLSTFLRESRQSVKRAL